MTATPPPSREPSSYDLRGGLATLAVLATGSAAGGWLLRDARISAVSLVLLAASGLRLASQPAPQTTSRAVHRVVGGAVNATVFVVMLAVSVLAGEGVARWIYRDVTTTADFRGYFTTKWMRSQVRHNHYEYRGAEFDEVKAPGVYRIAVMGDSFTYGNGIPEDRRFSNLIGAALHDQPIEVLNFGFPGNNWPEHVRTLERRVLRLRPDFVLLQWGTNDIELDGDVRGRPQVPPLIADREWHEALYRRSALYTMLNAQWIRYQLQRDMGDTYPNYLRRLYMDPASEGARQADRLMRRFVELARSRGGEVGLVLFPDAAVPLGDDYPFRFMHEQVQAICAETHVRCVDVLPKLAAVPDRFTLWASPLDSHPSVLANRIAAAAVLDAFRPAWVNAAAAVHAAMRPVE